MDSLKMRISKSLFGRKSKSLKARLKRRQERKRDGRKEKKIYIYLLCTYIMYI